MPIPDQPTTPGRIVHYQPEGLSECRPAIITRDWGGGAINARGFLDGSNDSAVVNQDASATTWLTSAAYDPEVVDQYHWHWPQECRYP